MKTLKNKKMIIIFCLLAFLIAIVFLCVSFPFKKIKGEVNSIYQNGNEILSIEINDYDKNNGIGYRDIIQVTINAKFNSDTSSDKKVKISLTEGMTYESFYVKEDADGITKKQLNETDDLYKAIKSIETPTIHQTGYSNVGIERYSYGDLVYNINDNITSVSININIKADAFRFYGEKNIINALNISSYESNEKLGEISEDIIIAEYDENSDYNFLLHTTNVIYYSSKNIFTSNEVQKNYGYSHIFGLFIKQSTKSETFSFQYTPYYKELTYYIYYPEGTTFEGFYNSYKNNITETINNMKKQGSLDYEIDPINNRVKMTFYKFHYMGYGIGIIFSAPEDILNNEKNIVKTTKEYNKAVIKFYDDEEKEITIGNKYSINIYHPSTYVNKLDVTATSNYDDDNDSTFTFGPMFKIINKTPGEKTNQTLEFVFDNNYQVVGVNIPYSITTSKLTKIQYKTNKSNDTWITFNNSWSNRLFTKFNAGYKKDDGIYFTAIKVTVSNYAEEYETGIAAPKSSDNLVLYGNLLSSTDNANVTLLTYDESDKENTLTQTTSTISKIKEKKTSSAVVSNKNFFASKQLVNAGESFDITATLAAHSYPYGNVNYIDNVEFYIRQPIGTTINTNSITIKDTSNNIVSYEIKSHVNKYGETIYILKTDYTVGRYLTEKLISDELIVNFSVKVNLDSKLIDIQLKDIIAWGNNETIPVAPTKTVDIYDFDGDNDYNDYVFYTGNNRISILPSKSVVVSTYASSNGVNSSPYDKNNVDSIMEINNSKTIDYNVKIWNNSGTKVNNLEMYIPIPKRYSDFKDVEYTFEWNISLINKINVSNKFKVLYSVDNNKKISELEYTENIDDLSKVTAIKIILKETLDKEDEYIINIPLKVHENRRNFQLYNNKLNIWYPKYYIETNAITGIFDGTGVGLKLFVNEISGKIYYDNNANGIYEEKIDEPTSNVAILFYKLNASGIYELIETPINYDINEREYFIDEYILKEDEEYAIEFKLPEGYFITTNKDNWIKNITKNNLYNKDIGIVKYELDFDIKDYTLIKDKSYKVNITNLKPDFFDNIKNDELSYHWELVDINDKEFIEIENINEAYTMVKPLKEKNSIKAKVTIFDKFGNQKTKEFNINIKSNGNPTIVAEDVYIDIGNKIEFEKYVLDSINYRNEKIKLMWSGDNTNITYDHNIPNISKYSTKAGSYKITYILEDEYGKTTKTIRLIVNNKFDINNPSTSDTISKFVLLLISFISLAIISIYKLKR